MIIEKHAEKFDPDAIKAGRILYRVDGMESDEHVRRVRRRIGYDGELKPNGTLWFEGDRLVDAPPKGRTMKIHPLFGEDFDVTRYRIASAERLTPPPAGMRGEELKVWRENATRIAGSIEAVEDYLKPLETGYELYDDPKRADRGDAEGALSERGGDGKGDLRQEADEGGGRVDPGEGGDVREGGGSGELPGREDADARRYASGDGGHLPEDIRPGGPKARIAANLRALRLVGELTARGARANEEERAALAAYTGWGAVPQIFDEAKDDFAAEREELKGLLTDDEYEAAMASTLNAHYTSLPIVRAMHDALRKAGWDGEGTMLEPGCGIGHFIGAAQTRNAIGIELDPTSARIAKALYPDADIRCGGLQEQAVDTLACDVAIGNPPFGPERLFDPAHPDLSKLSIHNYFITKSMRAVRPGGMGAFVVSRYFLDAQDAKARELINKDCDLVGAVRLPKTAFQQNAGTEVVCDIVIFRKRGENERPPVEDPEWLDTTTTVVSPDPEDHDYRRWVEATVNKSMAGEENAHRILGRPSAQGSMYRKHEYTVEGDAEDDQIAFGEKVKAALEEQVAEGLYVRSGEKAERKAPAAAPQVPERQMTYGGFADIDDVLHLVQIQPKSAVEVAPVKTKPAAEKRIRGLMEIRDMARALVHDEQDVNGNEMLIEENRVKLREAVDKFRAEHKGEYASPTNRRLFASDPEAALVFSLYDDERAEHAPILVKRVTRPHKPPESADSLEDAISISYAEFGGMNVERLAELTDQTVEEVRHILLRDARAFENPDAPDGPLVDAREYLSGNVRERRDALQERNDPRFARNLAALEKAVPSDLLSDEISMRVGAGWIPTRFYEEFMQTVMGCGANATLRRGEKGYAVSNAVQGWTPAAAKFSTNYRAGWRIFESMMNGTPYRPGGEDITPQQRQKMIEEVGERAAAIEEAFEEYCRGAPAAELTDIYNKTFRSHVSPPLDKTTPLPTLGEDQERLYPSQAVAARRMIQQPSLLLNHAVGAGKTLASITGVMERRRLGLTRKAMVVVPNHLVSQWRSETLRAYPHAKVLALDAKGKAARQTFLARAATGEWDFVICPESAFKMIPNDPSSEFRSIRQEIRKLTSDVDKQSDSAGRKLRNASVKALERAKTSLANKVKALQKKPHEDGTVFFDDLGIDMLVVDEAHHFKNLHYEHKGRLSGLGPPKGSQKARDLLTKMETVREKENAQVTFLTGTPVSNTLAEIYHMQRYLKPEQLERTGTENFQSWLTTFARVDNQIEVTLTGTGFKSAARVSKLVNLPELQSLFSEFSDTLTKEKLKEMLNARKGPAKLPDLKGDGPLVKVSQRSPEQAVAMEEIVQRMSRMGHTNPRKDNPLKALSDGRKRSLDIRIDCPAAPPDKGSKVEMAAREIVRAARDSKDVRGAQLVFCDLSTPKSFRADEAAEVEELSRLAAEGDLRAIGELEARQFADVRHNDFDVYNELRERVIELSGGEIGVDEFAFVHEARTEAARKQLDDKVRSGEVRVLMGSTAKMGTGMNVQERLVALHHLDAPWRPADMEQREGRIVRRGNKLIEDDPERRVAIYRYARKQTSDPLVYQTLERKARFIERFYVSALDQREADDIGDSASSFEEIKAITAGNPKVFEEVEARLAAKKISTRRAAHFSTRRALRDAARRADFRKDRAEENIGQAKQLLADVKDTKKGSWTWRKGDFKRTLQGLRSLDRYGGYRTPGGAYLESRTETLGSYRGIDLQVDIPPPSGWRADSCPASIHWGSIQLRENFNALADPISERGLQQQIEGLIRKAPEVIKTNTEAIQGLKKDAEEARAESELPFPEEAEWEAARANHARISEELRKEIGEDWQKGAYSSSLPDFVLQSDGTGLTNDGQVITGKDLEATVDLGRAA